MKSETFMSNDKRETGNDLQIIENGGDQIAAKIDSRRIDKWKTLTQERGYRKKSIKCFKILVKI